MTEFKKKDLLTSLKEIDEMLTLSLASITYFHRDKNLKMLSQTWMMHFGRVWNLESLAKELQDNKTKSEKLDEYRWIIQKFFLREPFSIILEYCRINQFENELKNQNWYQLARILRNYATHGFLDSTQYNKNIFPVKWDQYVIEWNEIDKGVIDFTKFDINLPQKLFDEINQFANMLPNN